METPLEKMLLSKQETARILSISEKMLWRLTYPRGPIISIQLGSRVLYSIETLRCFIQQQEAKLQKNDLLQQSSTTSLSLMLNPVDSPKTFCSQTCGKPSSR